MADCENVEIRELLPERGAGVLGAADTARVDAHVAACNACRDELDILVRSRRVMHRAPAVDADRVARAVVVATRGVRVSRVRRPHWGTLRIAASLALAAVGLTTFGIWRGTRGDEPAAQSVVASTATRSPAALAPAGGLAGLDDSQLSALLDDLGTLEAAPAAEPEAVVPQFADLALEEIQ